LFILGKRLFLRFWPDLKVSSGKKEGSRDEKRACLSLEKKSATDQFFQTVQTVGIARLISRQ